MQEEYPIYKISLNQNIYPQYLSQLYDPPAILYCRGNLSILTRPTIAVVGSRRHSSYAIDVIQKIIPPLTNDLTIISGLALGIDALAHQVTLDNNGLTVAVLGSGIDNASIYPKTNYQLAQNILQQGGLLLSEYLPGTKTLPHHFPRRNRIISGLSLGVLIIEAQLPSGSLTTAKHALEQNREVLAVPGSINISTSAGTNYLIKQGAHVVVTAEDVFNVLALTINN